jgi:hypothetical protein
MALCHEQWQRNAIQRKHQSRSCGGKFLKNFKNF